MRRNDACGYELLPIITQAEIVIDKFSWTINVLTIITVNYLLDMWQSREHASNFKDGRHVGHGSSTLELL